MRKPLAVLAASTLLVLPACNYGAMDTEDIYKESGNTINVTDRNELDNRNQAKNGDDSRYTNFGYVRHQSRDNMNYRNNTYTPVIDREALADAIGKLVVQLPNVEDAGALVTDEEVFVVYETNSDNRVQTADQVKRTALSAVPRYYHAYVSDDPNMFKEVERFGNLDSNARDIDKILDKTIQQMKNSPQGLKVDDGENENGEMTDDMNEAQGGHLNGTDNTINDISR